MEDVEQTTQSILTRMLEQAVNHYEEHLEPDQVKATEYYKGEPFGDEEEGRSQVVSTDVRDAVQAIMPSLMRIFFGSEHVVEYRPDGPEDEEEARQATDYAKYIVVEDNPGFLAIHSVFKDALVRRVGYLKWWRDESTCVKAASYSGLSIEQVRALAAEEGVTLTELEQTPYGVGGGGDAPQAGYEMQMQPTFNVKLTRKYKEMRIRVQAVPPNELVSTPNARCLDDAPLVAHVREATVSELVAMGLDKDEVMEQRGRKRGMSTEDLEQTRQFHDGGLDEDTDGDETTERVIFAEAYAMIDVDDDGIAERRKFWAIGPSFKIVSPTGDEEGEIVDEVPIADFCMDPEPHTIVGLSMYDYLKDVQRVKSQVLRGTLNSLALSLEQATEVVMGEVNMQDVMSREVNKILRVRKPGMIREVKHSFVGADTLPVLAYYDEIKENRTGVSKAAAGLDADALQSSTKAAVAATISAAQQHIEMIARVFAETGMKRLFRGLLKLMVQHQDRPRMIRLRGKFVEVDPRQWNADMDVTVNVALGAGSPEERMMVLGALAEKQEAHIQQQSPLVGFTELRNTYARMVELSGFKNSAEFFKPFGAQEEQQMQQQKAQNPPPPDPNMALVQIEQEKAQAQMQLDQIKLQMQQAESQEKSAESQQKLQLEQWRIQLEDDRERDRIARDFALKERELELKYQQMIVDAELNTQVARERAALDAQVKTQVAQMQAEVKAETERMKPKTKEAA